MTLFTVLLQKAAVVLIKQGGAKKNTDKPLHTFTTISEFYPPPTKDQ